MNKVEFELATKVWRHMDERRWAGVLLRCGHDCIVSVCNIIALTSGNMGDISAAHEFLEAVAAGWRRANDANKEE